MDGGRNLGAALRERRRFGLAGLKPVRRGARARDPVPGERLFRSRVPIRFVLEPATDLQERLVVVFSSDHPADQPPPYHYRWTLREVGCHKLFIRDDHGPGGSRPCWYLGRSGDLSVADSVVDLVATARERLGIRPAGIVTVGSSKGGWAALYLGARLGVGNVIAGEPQTLLGTFLFEGEQAALGRYIAGGDGDSERARLDALVFDAIRRSPRMPRFHLLCGQSSPYYRDHVQPLLAALEAAGAESELVLGPWADHVPDLGRNFPAFMLGRLSEILA